MYSPHMSKPLPEVPILRLYGSTALGQKCCVHVHKVTPQPDRISSSCLTDLGISIFLCPIRRTRGIGRVFDQDMLP